MKQTIPIIFLTALLTLGGSACSDVSEQDGFPPVSPADGERIVNLSLTGLAGGGAVPTRAGNESLTLEGECEVRLLTVYCFVSWDGTTEQTDVTNFKHERTYHYEAGGTDNDFLLLPDADGYHAGIGVPEGDAHQRAFLVCANRGIANPPGDWANLTYGTAISTFKWTPDRESGGTAYLPPACPLLPMSAKVTHRVISSDGVISDDPVFSPQQLDRGLSVRLVRGVSRIDIVNPDITGYRVEGIQVKAAAEMALFAEPAGAAATEYKAVPLSVTAVQTAGACYLFPLKADTEVEIGLTGKLMNNELPLTARGIMKPNTRYLLRVRNDDANLGVSLEVADWDEGNGIDTGDLSDRLNAGCTVEVAPSATGVAVAGTTITLRDGILREADPAIVTLTGASGDTKPIGIQIPEGCDWLAAGTGQVTGNPSSETFQTTLEMKQPAVTRTVRAGIGGGSFVTVGNDYPLRVPVSFVYEKDGKTCFVEYTVCLEPAAAHSPALASVEVRGVGLMKELCRVDPDARVIRLPAFGGAAFRVIGHEVVTRAVVGGGGSYLEFFAREDYDWVKKVSVPSPGAVSLYFRVDENRTGHPREATFRMRYRDANNGDAPVEADWLVVQEADPDPAQMADDVEVRLPLREAGELRMEGSEIRVAMRDPIRVGDDGFNEVKFYEAYIRTLRESGPAAAGKQLKAIVNRIELTVTEGGVNDNPFCVGLLYPALSAPVKVTVDASWLHAGYEVTAPCISLKADLYVPVTVEEIGNLPPRTATVSVELRNGETRKLTVRQEPHGVK